MEDVAEKMEALKRACADIILNTAKEAAARVLAADRRAVQLERSLSMAKEESLALLLRVKTIMDSKVKEAEKAKLSQARKIHGLQIKLREAKEIIETLRSELNRVHSDLEHKKSKQAKSAVMATADIKRSSLSQKDKVGHCCLVKSPSVADSLKGITTTVSAGKPDLASIILTNKEQEPYRNGCTQRIRALEHILLTRSEHVAVSDELPKMDNKTNRCENGMAERSTAENSRLTDKTSQLKASLDSKEVGLLGKFHGNDHAVKICSWRRRRRMQRKRTMKPRPFHALNDMAAIELINGHLLTNGAPSDMTRSIDTMHARPSELSQESPNSNFSQTSMEDLKTSKGTSTELKESLNCQSSVLPPRPTVTELCDTSLENHIDEDIKSNSGNIGEEDKQNQLLLFSLIDMNDSSLSDEGIKQETNGEKVVENSRPIDRDCNTVDESVTSSQKESQEVVLSFKRDESRDGETCRMITHPTEAPIDNIVKYRRKRRRGSLETKNETISLEENDSSRRKMDVEDHLVEPQKTSSVIDSSSRDSRRLVQVARQLISLSEKRW